MCATEVCCVFELWVMSKSHATSVWVMFQTSLGLGDVFEASWRCFRDMLKTCPFLCVSVNQLLCVRVGRALMVYAVPNHQPITSNHTVSSSITMFVMVTRFHLHWERGELQSVHSDLMKSHRDWQQLSLYIRQWLRVMGHQCLLELVQSYLCVGVVSWVLPGGQKCMHLYVCVGAKPAASVCPPPSRLLSVKFLGGLLTGKCVAWTRQWSDVALLW